jgi:hypothetical protein
MFRPQKIPEMFLPSQRRNLFKVKGRFANRPFTFSMGIIELSFTFICGQFVTQAFSRQDNLWLRR